MAVECNEISDLQFVQNEISDIKYNLMNVLQKIEYYVNCFVSFKAKLSPQENYQQDVLSLDNFFDELNREIFASLTKVNNVEERNKSLFELLKETFNDSKQLKIKNETILNIVDEEKNNFQNKELDVDDNTELIEGEDTDIDYQLDDEINSGSEGNSDQHREENSAVAMKGRRSTKKSKILKSSLGKGNSSDRKPKRMKFSPRKRQGEKSEDFTENLKPSKLSVPRQQRSYPKFNKEKVTKYKCFQCSKIFTDKMYFKEHEHYHEREHPFVCNMCGLRFKDHMSLDTHKVQSHESLYSTGKEEFKCFACEKPTLTSLQLFRHINRMHTQFFECPLCMKEYADLKGLEIHYARHNMDTDVSCLYCQRQFITKMDLQLHLNEYHGLMDQDLGNASDEDNDNKDEFQSIDRKDDIVSQPTSSEANEQESAMLLSNDQEMGNGTLEDIEFYVENTSDQVNFEGDTGTDYQCKECGKEHSIQSHLHMHILEEHSMKYFKKYKCNISSCSKIFSERQELDEHKRLDHDQHEPYGYTCFKCELLWPTQDDLEEHNKEAHENDKNDCATGKKDFKCAFCSKKYLSAATLQKHQRKHSDELFECPVCKKLYKDPKELNWHFYTHIVKKLKCSYCGQQFQDRIQLAAHMLESHDFKLPASIVQYKDYSISGKKKDKNTSILMAKSKNPRKFRKSNRPRFYKSKGTKSVLGRLTCHICTETFTKRPCYFKHRKTHSASEFSFLLSSSDSKDNIIFDLEYETISNEDTSVTYKCKVCDKCFSKRLSAERHLTTHIPERPYQCPSCVSCFKDDSQLRKHFIELHKDAGASGFSCSRMGCTELFDTRAALVEHKRTVHAGEKPFQCVDCGKFFSESGLRHHICAAVAVGEKQFTCDVCFRKYYTNFHLKVHKRQAHRGKSHVCEICGKAYLQKGRLDEHRRSHTGEKPYECVVCNKRFRTSGRLKEHSNVHIGKRHSCQMCGSTYAFKKGLKLHMKKSCVKNRDNLPIYHANIDATKNMENIQIYHTNNEVTSDHSSSNFMPVNYVGNEIHLTYVIPN